MNPVSPSAAPSTAPERIVPARTPVMVESTAQPPRTGQTTVPPVLGGGRNARQAAQTMQTTRITKAASFHGASTSCACSLFSRKRSAVV